MTSTMLQDFTQLQSKGLLTIPKKFREALGIGENQLLRLTKDDNRLIVEPVEFLTYPVRRYTETEIQEFFDKDDQDSRQLKIKDLL